LHHTNSPAPLTCRPPPQTDSRPRAESRMPQQRDSRSRAESRTLYHPRRSGHRHWRTLRSEPSTDRAYHRAGPAARDSLSMRMHNSGADTEQHRRQHQRYLPAPPSKPRPVHSRMSSSRLSHRAEPDSGSNDDNATRRIVTTCCLYTVALHHPSYGGQILLMQPHLTMSEPCFLKVE